MASSLTPILLGAAFITTGVLFISPIISPDVHQMMAKKFDQKFPVNPLVEHKLVKLDAATYRFGVGVTAIVCGAIILIGPYALLHLAYLTMVIVLSVDVYCHVKLDHRAKQLAPSACFLFVTLMQFFTSRRVVVHVKED